MVVFAQDTPVYEIDSNSVAGSNAADFFYLNPSSGVLFVRADLRTSGQNQYTVSVCLVPEPVTFLVPELVHGE